MCDCWTDHDTWKHLDEVAHFREQQAGERVGRSTDR